MKYVLKVDSLRFGKGVFITDDLRIALEQIESMLDAFSSEDAERMSFLNILVKP